MQNIVNNYYICESYLTSRRLQLFLVKRYFYRTLKRIFYKKFLNFQNFENLLKFQYNYIPILSSLVKVV